MNEPRSTAERILLPGEVVRAGSETGYRNFRYGPGEAHGVRADFMSADTEGSRKKRRLFKLGHVTDLHIADAGSPLRLDFASRDPEQVSRWRGAVTYTHRAPELVTTHAAAAIVDTLSRVGIDLGIVTGDAVDNAQWNELQTYLTAVDGGTVGGILGRSGHYSGPQSEAWEDRRYWLPDGGDDDLKQRHGYPTIPGYVDAACRSFEAPGFRSPWVSCLGNHDLLVGGTTSVRSELNEIAVGGRKPIAFPDGWHPAEPIEEFLRDPAIAYAGPIKNVRPNADRRLVSTADFVREHRRLGRGVGARSRGFTEQNEREGTAYYAYDATPEIRVIVLDTNHRQGHWDGSMDRVQLEWLREQLAALRGDDAPYVILASHHATPSLTNNYGVCPDTPYSEAYASEIVQIALECPNVVLWLNGHHHANRVAAHFHESGGGFFEITTTSIVDSPGQARVIEIWRCENGSLEIVSTMYDADVPLIPVYEDLDYRNLASLHREVSANDVWRGSARQGLGGLPTDRNVRLLLPAR